MQIQEILTKYGHLGIFQESELDGGRFRCKCNWKRCGSNWQEYDYRRHMSKQCHKNWMRDVEERGFEQATYAHIAANKAETEAERLEKAGTRAQQSTDADVPFRKDAVKSFVGAGVPLRKVQKLRTFLQKNCNKSLSHPQHLNGYVPELVSDETALQTD